MHRDASVIRDAPVPSLVALQIGARHLVVGILRGLRGDVDHGERHDESLRRDQVRGDPPLGKMDRCVEMRAGMFDDAPPVQVEAVLLEGELRLQLDARHAEEGREVGRHRMREIDHRPEAARCGRLCCGRRDRGGGEGGRGRAADRAPEETAAAERAMHRRLASGNTHDDLLPLARRQDGRIAGPRR
jgi:hypothetical protein